jgi:micrococcal nuclease
VGGLEVSVKQVVDGDTLRVAGLPTGNGLVRLTGIDAPETGDGRTTRECFGPEARQWLRDRTPPGTRVRLMTDIAERDRFGRLLAYAYAGDGAFLNAELVALGYARTMTIRPNVRHAKDLQAAERRAQRERVGLWGACPDTRPRR